MNEGRLIKERILSKKAEHILEESLFTFTKKPPIFGLSSTPGLGRHGNIVKPSSFDYFSPIARDTTWTPKRAKLPSSVLNDEDISRIVVAESPAQDWQSPLMSRPSRNAEAEDHDQLSSPQQSAPRTSLTFRARCGTPESLQQSGTDHRVSDRHDESISPCVEAREKLLQGFISPALITPPREETSHDGVEASVNGEELENNWSKGSPFIGFSSGDLGLCDAEGQQSVSMLSCRARGLGSTRPRADTEPPGFVGFSSFVDVDQDLGATCSRSHSQPPAYFGGSSSDVFNSVADEGLGATGSRSDTETSGFIGFDSVGERDVVPSPFSTGVDAVEVKGNRIETETGKRLLLIGETCDIDEKCSKHSGHVTIRRGAWGSSRNRCVDGSNFSKNQSNGVNSPEKSLSLENTSHINSKIVNWQKFVRDEGSCEESRRGSAERKTDDYRNVTIRKRRSLRRERAVSTSTSSSLSEESGVGLRTLADEEAFKMDPVYLTADISREKATQTGTVASTDCPARDGARSQDNDSDAPEISPYFSTLVPASKVVSETSSSSFIMNSSSETDKPNTPPVPTTQVDELKASSRSYEIREPLVYKTSSEEEEDQLRGLPCLNKTQLRLSCTVLMGGKMHKRARGVLRQLQSGRLTLHDASLLPLAPHGRGRGYESLVETVLGMQPGKSHL